MPIFLIFLLACIGAGKGSETLPEKRKEIDFVPVHNNWINAKHPNVSVPQAPLQIDDQKQKKEEVKTPEEIEKDKQHSQILKEAGRLIIGYNKQRMIVKRQEEDENPEETKYFWFEQTKDNQLKAHQLTHRNVEHTRKHSDLQVIRKKGVLRGVEYLQVFLARFAYALGSAVLFGVLMQMLLYRKGVEGIILSIDLLGNEPLGFPIVILVVILLALVFMTFKRLRRVKIAILSLFAFLSIAGMQAVTVLDPITNTAREAAGIEVPIYFLLYFLFIVAILSIFAIETGFRTTRESVQPQIRRRRALRGMGIFMAAFVALVLFTILVDKEFRGTELVDSFLKNIQSNILDKFLILTSVVAVFFTSILLVRMNSSKEEKVSKEERSTNILALLIFGVTLVALILLQLFLYHAGISQVVVAVRILEGVLALSLVSLGVVFLSTMRIGRHSSIRKHRRRIVAVLTVISIIAIITAVVFYIQTANELIKSDTLSHLKAFWDNPIAWFSSILRSPPPALKQPT